ncbi:OsmC family protein [bacterium]|nr:OsmC family protein [bacterium]
MAVEMDLVYQGNLHCQATHGPSGNTLVTDAPVDNGGQGSSFSPTDLVATALGACMVTIMGIVAKRDGLAIEGTTVHVAKEMVQQPARRIGTLTVKIAVAGGSKISSEDRLKLERAALTCPVHKSLHPDIQVPIEFHYTD